MIRLLIADEHPVARQGLQSLLSGATDIEIVAAVESASEMVRAAAQHRPDVILMDLCVRRHRIADAVETIRQENGDIRIVIFTTFRGADEVALALHSHIEGYALKTDSPADLTAAIQAAARGVRWLSPHLDLRPGDAPSLTERERQVLGAIATGKSNQQVADALFISEGTVKFHVNNILNKLGADDRTEAVVIGLHRGLLRLAE